MCTHVYTTYNTKVCIVEQISFPMIFFITFHFQENGNVDDPIWLNAAGSDAKSGFDHLQRKINVNGISDSETNNLINIFDKETMNIEIIDTTETHTTIKARYNQTNALFTLNKRQSETTAMTVCRASPTTTQGIQTLNTMFDPLKEPERITNVQNTKAKYHQDFEPIDIEKSYKKLFELLWYTRLPCFDVKDITSKERDEMSVIKRCYWRSKMVDCASIFVTRSTDHGMCCTFNSANAEQIFKDTLYGNMTSEMQSKDKRLSFEELVSKDR